MTLEKRFRVMTIATNHAEMVVNWAGRFPLNFKSEIQVFIKLATGSNQINTFRLFLTTSLHRFNYAAAAAPYHANGDDAVGTPAERRRYAASLRSTALSIILRVFTGIPNQLFVWKPAV
jgi:hypothetical protein